MFTKTFKFGNQKSADKLTFEVVRDVCEAVNSPRSLAVFLMFKHKEHEQLIDLNFNPHNYLDPNLLADDYLVSSFLTKADFLELRRDTKAEALKNFEAFEQQCYLTNQRLKASGIRAQRHIECISHSVMEKFKKLLPPLNSELYSEILEACSWGPGTTSSAKGSALSRYNKLQSELQCTTDLIACGAHFLVNSIPAWSSFHGGSESPDNLCSVTSVAFCATPGNKLTTVPKNAKTDRTIAVEPHVNAFLQRGIGVTIRKRLATMGCNLLSQERNRALAKEGSITGQLATIDLKGASDTISSELVRTLLPPDWYSLLENARSKFYEKDGKWILYNKHSSMGNGYTFELESAIFFLLALSCCEYLGISTEKVSVYGDDIIIPVAATQLFSELCTYYGFTTNSEKTFTTGFFRESCGADFYRGIQIRPFFLRKRIEHLDSVYTLANTVRHYSAMRCNYLAVDGRFLNVRNNIIRFLPQKFRLYIPEGYSGGFHCGFEEATQSIRTRKSREYPSRRTEFESKRLVFRSSSRVKDNAIVTIASALWDMPTHVGVDPGVPLDRTRFEFRNKGTWAVTSSRFNDWSPGYLVV